MTEEKIAQIDAPETATLLTEREKIAMQLVELLCTDPEAIADSFFDELRLYFAGDQIVELMYLTLVLNMSHRVGAANHTGPPDGDRILVKPNSFLSRARSPLT